jgi:hypothetical protein
MDEFTPPQGVTSARREAVSGTHRHFWSDVTSLEGEYTEELCAGEKWCPGEHVFPKGCGARRRILKTAAVWPASRHDHRPPDEAWELLHPGRTDPGGG